MKVVVIDDDPTGSQTVHGCPLLLRWDPRTLQRALRHPSPLLFLLADTRSLTPTDAEIRNQEIAANLDQALQAEGLRRSDLLLVSRGDSTLRGHGVLEPQALRFRASARKEGAEGHIGRMDLFARLGWRGRGHVLTKMVVIKLVNPGIG